MPAWLTSVLAFVVVIGLLVAIHEFGHYWVARRMGVRVLRYAIGFGPKIWGRTSTKTGIEYWLCALPLGGYVKMLDEREGPVDPAEQHLAFNRQTPLKRIAIVAAGPAVNLVFAVLAYWLVLMLGVTGLKPIIDYVPETSVAAQATLERGDEILAINQRPIASWQDLNLALIEQALKNGRPELDIQTAAGDRYQTHLDLSQAPHDPEALFDYLGLTPFQPKATPLIAEVVAHSAADHAGLQAGDALLAINDEAVDSPTEFVQWVQAHPNAQATFTVRRDEQEIHLPVTLGSDNEDGQLMGRLGAAIGIDGQAWSRMQTTYKLGPLAAMPAAVTKTWDMSVLTVRMMAQMVTGHVSARNISGPVQIANYAGKSASIGLNAFIGFMAIVSLSLGLLNLLPVPVLDGGHLLYYGIELIRGKPLAESTQMIGQQIGLVLLMLLMGLAFYNDILQLLG